MYSVDLCDKPNHTIVQRLTLRLGFMLNRQFTYHSVYIIYVLYIHASIVHFFRHELFSSIDLWKLLWTGPEWEKIHARGSMFFSFPVIQRMFPQPNKSRECGGLGGNCSDIWLIWSVDRRTATKSWVNKQFRALNPVHDESLMISTQICCHIISPFNHFPLSAQGLTEKQA